MNDFTCKHGALIYVPPGKSSRTGNNYNGFWKCVDDECFVSPKVRNAPENAFNIDEPTEPEGFIDEREEWERMRVDTPATPTVVTYDRNRWGDGMPEEHTGKFPGACPRCEHYINVCQALPNSDYSGRDAVKHQQVIIANQHMRWSDKQVWPGDPDEVDNSEPVENELPVDDGPIGDPWSNRC